MIYTGKVRPNKNLKAMLGTHSNAKFQFEQGMRNRTVIMLNAFADVYAEDPKDALETFDLILKSRGRAPLRTASI